MNGRRRGGGPVRIDGVVGPALSGASPDGGKLFAILERYRSMVSETTMEHARPTSIRKDVLIMTVTDPVWMTELRFFVPRFLEAFNSVLPVDARLRDIRLRVGILPGPLEPSRAQRLHEAHEATGPAGLPADIRKRIERVTDPALRELMLRVASGAGEKGK